MATFNCNACDTIRKIDPEMVINGIGEDECTSLKNNTGIVPDSGDNDEASLNDINDCLIGNLMTDISDFDSCDWQEFMSKYMPNEWTTNKAIICAIAGLWENMNQLWDAVNAINNQ